MANGRSVRFGFGCTVALIWSAWQVGGAGAVQTIGELRSLAKQSEQAGDWAKACAYYSYILTKNPTLADVKEHFQTCLRHFHRVRRHTDASYRQQVLSQEITAALRLYGEVLEQLRGEYWEEDRANLTRLFRQGVEELRLALRDEAFRRQYLPEAKSEAVDQFLARLRATWAKKEIRFALDAQAQVLQLALAAKNALGLSPTVTVLEFACGACNALDEHTYYLTPRQFGEDAAALRGETIGVGIEVAFEHGRLILSHVAPNSPAFKAGLSLGDRILRIDGGSAERLSLEAAANKLKGRAGTTLDLVVASQPNAPRAVTLTRQPVLVNSTAYRMLDTEAAYLQLTAFHDHTVDELDAALLHLEMQGMKSLVLDLRGNSGGGFDAAIRVAERFLGEGSFIASAHGRGREIRRTSHNMTPQLVPLVVLVDGNTASAAEIVAGALKENGRATLVGQTTFGKNTVQHVAELKSVQAGGLRITWAKLLTPLGRDVGTPGVMPHLFVERTSRAFDEQLQAALGLLSGR